MQYHPGGGQRASEDADAKRDGVYEPVDKGMKADAEHGYQSDTVPRIQAPLADEGGDKPIE